MYDYKNKVANINSLNKYMLARTLSMFNYLDLPSTLPDIEIEKQLQQNGYTFITKVNDNLYAFQGGLGGEPNPYGEHTKITISNPSLKFNETLDIEKDGVLIKNDDMQLGLLNLYEKYNSLLIENEITMFINSYNSRIQTLMSAGDDSTKESAELYLKKVVDGELGIIGENRLFEGIKAQNTQNNNSISMTQLIEFNQYLKATLFNEIGVNANFNMKRERLNSSEVDMNTDSLHTLTSNMLINRQKGIAKLNEMYGLNASVDFGSIWKERELTTIDKSDTMQDEPKILDDENFDEPIVEDDDPIVEDDDPIVEDDDPIVEDDDPIVEDDDEIIEDDEEIR